MEVYGSYFGTVYFCLSCFAAKEEETRERVSRFLEGATDCEFLVWFPKKEVHEKRKGRYETVEKPMFSNYLFIYWNGEDEKVFPFHEIRKIPTVIKVLKYDDSTHALKGKDLAFAKWIHTNDGHIKQSKVIYREGQRLHICDGPLKGYDGNVVKVDKHHKRIVVRFELGDIVSDVVFSVEFLSASQDPAADQR